MCELARKGAVLAAHSLATPSGITPWAAPYYIASRLALCMAAEGVATRVNTRVLQLPWRHAVVSRLVMATMTSTSSLCTLVTPDIIAQRSHMDNHDLNGCTSTIFIYNNEIL